MQDRFKFRVFGHSSKKMISISDVGSSRDFYYGIFTDNRLLEDYFGKGVYTIMQCTGLKDKNGKLIYEGDVLQCNRMPTKGLCEWFKDGFWVNYFINGAKRELRNMHNWYEVIGNIYENPELIGGAE